jgi:hypothetical protein
MPRFLLLLAAILLFAAAPPARAEDPVTVPPLDSVDRLHTALRMLGETAETAFLGKVEHRNEAALAMAGMARMMTGGGSAEIFRGEFEALRTAAVRAVLSKSQVPGFGVFDDGTRRLTRAIYDAEMPDIASFRREALRLLDIPALQRAFSNMTWTADESGTVFTAKSTTSFLPADDSGGMIASRVKEVETSVTLAADGKVAKVRVTATRTDPLEAMRGMLGALGGMGGAGGMGGMGGMGGIPPAPADGELPQTTYTLEVASAPSPGMKDFVDEMAAVAGK